MDQDESGTSLSEAELRARIASGSREVADYLELANLLKSASRFDEAVEIYQQGLRLDLPNAEKARLAWELGQLLDKAMYRSTEAVTLAQHALRLLEDEPESPETLLLRGLSHSLVAQAVWFDDERAGAAAARQAIEWLERVIREHGQSEDAAAAFNEAAWAYSALGHQERAVELCQESMRRQTDSRHRIVALMTLAEAIRLAGRFREAEDAAVQALHDSSSDPLSRPVLYLTLGLIRRGANQPAAALTAFKQALTELQKHPFRRPDPELLRAIYGNSAELHYEAGDLGAAIGRFEQLLSQSLGDTSDRHRILIWLGNCHAARGTHNEARRYYEQVLASPVVGDEERTDAQDGLAALPPSRD